MRLLLDTHVFLWAVAGSARLKPAHRRLIESADEVHVSAASIWEVAIKVRLGKVQADPQALVEAIEASGFIALPVKPAHAAAVAALSDHHKDPFDRCGAGGIQRPGHAAQMTSVPTLAPPQT